MADKIWTATDVKMEKLVITRNGSVLTFERRYQFLDSGGEILDQISGGRIVEDIEFSALPPNIQTALQSIDAWTKNKALVAEGMD